MPRTITSYSGAISSISEESKNRMFGGKDKESRRFEGKQTLQPQGSVKRLCIIPAILNKVLVGAAERRIMMRSS